MSVSVSMPQLGESVTEGTVTRWLKREGERVEADEPLLEVSTDKVDTEIPSPVSGILRGITVAEDETVAVGAELAVIDEEGSADGAAAGAYAGGTTASVGTTAAADGMAAPAGVPPSAAAGPPPPAQPAPAAQGAGAAQPSGAPAADGTQGYNAAGYQSPYQQPYQPSPGYQPPAYQPPAPPAPPVPQAPAPQAPATPPTSEPAAYPPPQPPQAQPLQAQPQQAQPWPPTPPASAEPRPEPAPYPPQPAYSGSAQPADGAGPQLTSGAESPYVTPLVRKLAAEHGIDLATVAGTGVGGRIRKQDVLDAARVLRGTPGLTGTPQQAPPTAVPQQVQPQLAQPQLAPPGGQPTAAPPAPPAAYAGQAGPRPAPPRPAIVPSSLRGTTEKLSRSRQVIAQRMVESLQTSAQLTTVVEADVTAIARLRDRAKAGFEAREGVKLSYLPFFALATVEALKIHPKLNAIIDTAGGQVTYHDDEHLGIAVDTERGLMVPVIREAGDLNIAGLARKIADLAERTRAGRVSPDELSGGTFTLTNTGSRGALFDTPIINQPQVGILGTGSVVKRAVVVDDPALGEVIAVRSMVYLALTYDHRLVDGADAARFLTTLKSRLEEGAFETELGL
jgi:pyruvate dehydrogenase E2 component (dihydrolipoamide acetyltransferase)